MFKCIGYSIFINRSCNVIGMFLHFVHSISHCYSDGGMAQHTYIVSSVAKCHCFFQANTEVIDDFVDTLLFGISFGGDIGKGNQRPDSQSGNWGRISFSCSSVMNGVIWKISRRIASSGVFTGSTSTFR